MQLEESLAEPLLHQADSPDLDLASEVADMVEKLRYEKLSRRRSELTRMVEAGTATPEQRVEFSELLVTLATAKAGNPSPEERSKF